MATTQYIGSRYVPVFADPVEWDNMRTYEHLMMVQHNGETYISQQAVPVGINLPDVEHGIESNDYWVHMSNWNAQIESYREEVLTFNNRITSLEDALPVEDFSSENTVSSNVQDIDGRVDSLEDALPISSFSSTNTVLSNIQNKKRKFILLGDSYGYGYSTPTDTTRKGWLHRVQEIFSGWADVIYANPSEFPVGIYGFACTVPWLNILQGLANDIEDKYEITDIVVLGGTNDIANNVPNQNLIEPAIQAFCEYAHSTFPNATVQIGVLGSLSVGDQLYNIRNRYRTCEKYGAHYISTLANMICNPNYVTDGTHITQEAYAFYSPYVADAIINGDTKYLFSRYNQDAVNISNQRFLFTHGAHTTIYLNSEVTEESFKIGLWGESDNQNVSLTHNIMLFDQVRTLPYVNGELCTCSTCLMMPTSYDKMNENTTIYSRWDLTDKNNVHFLEYLPVSDAFLFPVRTSGTTTTIKVNAPDTFPLGNSGSVGTDGMPWIIRPSIARHRTL